MNSCIYDFILDNHIILEYATYRNINSMIKKLGNES